MKPTTITSMALVAGTYFFGAMAAAPKVIRAANATPTKEGTPVPSTRPVLNQLTSHGCYSSRGNMTLERDGSEVTSGKCGEYCKKKKSLALALRGSKCYCGDFYPPKADSISDSECNFPCPGYPLEACGSLDDDIYSIFNTGLELDVPEYEEEEETSTSATPSSTKPADKTSPAESTVTTTDPSSSNGGNDKKDGPNVAAIAAGVVVGVIVFGAGIGGLFFFMRRKRNAEIEEEHRRNAAVNAFINGSKPPGSSGSISMTDSRLDPVMAHRRLSDGSIADNQDYSRRILRVTNA